MDSPLFSVLVPTHSHGDLIEFPIRSVIRQTCQSFEILVVGDAISDSGRATVKKLAGSDPRIRFFDFPKGERHGEIHRNLVLGSEARGRYVAYLSDDDLFFPGHLDYLLSLLADHDFAHSLPCFVTVAGEVGVAAGDLVYDAIRNRLITEKNYNFIGLTGTAHSMELYRRLPFGWRTTPVGVPTDLYMWQQILSVAECRSVTGRRLTTLHFPDKPRGAWSHDERRAELARWESLLVAGDELGILSNSVATLWSIHTCLDERMRSLEFELAAASERLSASEREAERLRIENESLKRALYNGSSALPSGNEHVSAAGNGAGDGK